MSVTDEEVRRIAALARLGIPDTDVRRYAGELSRILDHMAVLADVDVTGAEPVDGVGAGGTPLRADTGPPIALAVSAEAFAPEMRDGFFLVPRLASHEDSSDHAAP